MSSASAPASNAHSFGDTAVPVIDLTPYFSGEEAAKRALAKEIDHACRTIGFLVITGHGVSPDLIAKTEKVTRAFFDLPMAAKQSYSKLHDGSRGYYGVAQSVLATTIGETSLPDLRETYTIGEPRVDPADHYYKTSQGLRAFPPNVYPAEIPGIADVWDAYFDALAELGVVLMRLFALALGLDEHWFDDKIDRHMTNLTVSNYPDQASARAPNQLRAGAHTDYGSMTILKTEDLPGGLEVRTADGCWEKVPIVPGAFIINLGDLMARWTNDQWVSTMHRVVNPPPHQTEGARRQSLIFFHQPNHDAVVECLPTCVGDGAKYPPTTSGEHLWMKLAMMAV